MSKPYDATTKRLMELHPEDWVDFLNLPQGAITLLDADLSTITTAADRILRVDGPLPYIVHNEFESGRHTRNVPFRLLQYNVHAEGKYGLPVVSTVFLLHPGSDHAHITGILRRRGPDGKAYHRFRYGAVRVWQIPAERFLTSGVSLLPFAPIAAVRETDLPDIIRRMETRVDREIEEDARANDLWTATYILMGLRYNSLTNAQLLQGVRRMKESVTYQAILEEGRLEGRLEGRREGRLEEARRLLLLFGSQRLGPVPATIRESIERIDSPESLEALVHRLMAVESWSELLP
ncbi:MAG: hypothetical protein SFU56_06945 [Capsulimonadales bacterium]|nr:hypothetical protein [Capsulimonadales bacterium]